MNPTGADASKPYNLEERTLLYARQVIAFVRACPRDVVNTELVTQLVRSAGSVGANYIEARESLGRRDPAMRIRICRKEASKSRFWLKLFDVKSDTVTKMRDELSAESTQLVRIFSSIVEKVKE